MPYKFPAVIQNNTPIQGDELNWVDFWLDWRKTHVAVIDQSSREFYRLAKDNAEITNVFEMRYMPGVTSKQRIVFKGRNFDIIGEPINKGENNRTLLVTCKAVI